MALSAATPALAASGGVKFVGGETAAPRSAPAVPPGRGGAPPAGAAGPREIHIHIHQLPGQDQQSLAREVARQLEALERGRAAAERSSYAED
jgi:hypothetical protein